MTDEEYSKRIEMIIKSLDEQIEQNIQARKNIIFGLCLTISAPIVFYVLDKCI